MIEILHEYWKPLLWTDGYRFTGVAIDQDIASETKNQTLLFLVLSS